METHKKVVRHMSRRITILGISVLTLALGVGGIFYFVINRSIFTIDDPLHYLDRPLVINIPVRYELSVQMGLTVDKMMDIKLTRYTNRPEETDSTPHHTASGRIVYDGSCAVSQDLYGPVLKRDNKKGRGIWPGDLIYVSSLNEYFVVEDTMNKRHKKHVDIFTYVKDLKKAQKFGLKRSDIYVIRLIK